MSTIRSITFLSSRMLPTQGQGALAQNDPFIIAGIDPRKNAVERRETGAQDTELFREALQYFIRHQDPDISTREMIREALQDSRKKKLNAMAESFSQGINLDELNRNLLVEALQICEGNMSRAAKLLGISRPTAVYRINKYGLNKKTSA